MFLAQHQAILILKKRLRAILFIGLIFVVITLVASIFFPLEYRADVQVLAISRSRYGVDPYTAAKTAERATESLSQVMNSNDFFLKVMQDSSSAGLDKSKFANLSEKKKRKLWEKSIATAMVPNTGLLNVSVFHINKDQAKGYANAVANTLVASAKDYTGGDVEVKVINDAVVGNWPERPNLVVNSIIAFIVGVLFASVIFVKRG